MKIIKQIMETSIKKLFLQLVFVLPLWSFSVGIIFVILGIDIHTGGTVQLTNQIVYKNLILAPFVIIVEQILFIYAPMMLLIGFFFLVKKWIGEKIIMMVIATIVVISSFFFGILHGGLPKVFIQGVNGIGFFIMYLRVLFDPKSTITKWQWRPLYISSLLHTGVDCILFIIQIIL